jgi:hypothetical protein
VCGIHAVKRDAVIELRCPPLPGVPGQAGTMRPAERKEPLSPIFDSPPLISIQSLPRLLLLSFFSPLSHPC